MEKPFEYKGPGGQFQDIIGSPVEASTTISPTDSIHHVTAETPVISTIVPPHEGFTGPLFLIADAPFTICDNGNIAVLKPVTLTGRAYTFLYDHHLGKWHFTDDKAPVEEADLASDLYGHWLFDEVSGTRENSDGTAPDLTEVGGTVDSTTGVDGGLAITGLISDDKGLETSSASIPVADGFTIALAFKWDYLPPLDSAAQSILTLGPSAAGTHVHIARFYNSYFIAAAIRWSLTQEDVIELPTPRLGPLTEDEWHLLVLTYDPVTGSFTGHIDEGCRVCYVPAPGTPTSQFDFEGARKKLRAIVPAEDLAAVNGITFTTMLFRKKFGSNFVAFQGEIDWPRIWNRCLTPIDVSAVYDEFLSLL
jgi:hypothetical protein